MKKIINGKKYNTQTAKEIGTYDNGRYDFTEVSETLYKKRTGEYFLKGSGGPMTKYAKSTGQNSWSGSTQIIPLTYENARKWAEEKLETEEYEEEFGEIKEEEGIETITISMEKELIAKLKREAQEKGKTTSEIIREMIKKQQEGEKK